MGTMGDALAIATTQSQMSSFFIDKMGVYNVLSYAGDQTINDGVTDATTVIQSVIDIVNAAGGGIVFVPAGTYAISDLILKPLVKLVGAGGKATVEVALGLTITQTTFKVASGNTGIIVSASTGHCEMEDFRVIGASGAVIGLDIRSYNVSTKNVGVYGFLDGVGVKLTNHYRASHINLDIQYCGLGLWLNGTCNALEFISPVIENCTCGIYSNGANYGVKFSNPTIESIGKGIGSTSFPDTDIITASATYLTDSGIATQADFEGGMYLVGSYSFQGGYMEDVNTMNIYVGSGAVFEMTGGYLNDNLADTRPRNFINGKQARSVSLKQTYISTDNARGQALFDLNTSRHNEVMGLFAYHTNGTVYTGTMYEDTTNTTFNANNGILCDASGNILSLAANKVLAKSQNVTSSSNAITINAGLYSVAYVDTLTENTTINTSNEKDGQYLEVHILQDATGGRTVAWNAKFHLSWSDTGNAANKKSCIAFRYRASQSRWYQIGGQVAYHD